MINGSKLYQILYNVMHSKLSKVQKSMDRDIQESVRSYTYTRIRIIILYIIYTKKIIFKINIYFNIIYKSGHKIMLTRTNY